MLFLSAHMNEFLASASSDMMLTFFTGQYNLIGYLQSEFSFHLPAHIGWEKSFLTLTNVDLRRGKNIQALQGQKGDLCFVLGL